MIHPTAIIHPSAIIENEVTVGPYAVIGEDTILRRGSRVGAHSLVEFADIGEQAVIFNNASIGTAPQDLKYNGEKTRFFLGKRTVVREFASLNRGTTASGKTVVGDDCLIMAYSHVAHDCRVGNNVIMANAATLGGHVEVGDRAVLGGIVAVHQFTRVGTLAMIGGGSMVSLDILPFAQAQGNRAKLAGLNVVGMRRRGLSREAMDEVKSAYKVLFLSAIPMEEAVDQLEASSPCPEVRIMIDFIHSSHRGICRPSRKEENEEP